jgi:hypothetical protein
MYTAVIAKYKPEGFMGVSMTALGRYDTAEAGWKAIARYFDVLVAKYGGELSSTDYTCRVNSRCYAASVERTDPEWSVDDLFLHEEEERLERG